MLNFLVISKKNKLKTIMRLIFTHKLIESLIDDTERAENFYILFMKKYV